MEVECFEVHHIDSNPLNNDIANLLYQCGNCHIKIEKGFITLEQAVRRKQDLKGKSWKIIFGAVTADLHSGWKAFDENEYAFYNDTNQTTNPILNFSLINHLSRTVILKTIRVRYKPLFSGISGPPPEPRVLYPLSRYHISLTNEVNVLHLQNPILVPAQEGFMFQVELSQGPGNGLARPFRGRKALYFTFEFSEGIIINAPTVYFNCKSEDEGIKLVMLD